jgi:hypothetical protein
VCCAKKAGSARRAVVSAATAFAPFSQNSKAERWSIGSGHAHPGQSNPLIWFTTRSARVPRVSEWSRTSWRTELRMDGSPPAGLSAGRTNGGVGSVEAGLDIGRTLGTRRM